MSNNIVAFPNVFYFLLVYLHLLKIEITLKILNYCECCQLFPMLHNFTLAGVAKVSASEHVRNNHLYRTQHWFLHRLLPRRYLGVPKTSLRVHEQEPDVTIWKSHISILSNILSYQVKCIQLTTIKQ